MIVKLFDISLKCIGLIAGADFTLTQKNYDFDSFTATGRYEGDDPVKNARAFMICYDDGSPMADPASSEFGSATASGKTDQITMGKYPSKKITVTGSDFRKILDTECEIDFSGATTGDCLNPSFFFNKVSNAPKSIANVTLIPYVGWDNTKWGDFEIPDDFSGQILFKNAWSFMKTYLAYLSFSVRMYLKSDWAQIYNTSENSVRSQDDAVSIYLKDFVYEDSAFSNTTNVAVPYVSSSSIGEPWYLYRSGDISKTAPTGDEIMWPVNAVYVQKDTLAEASQECILELAEARFQQNITISDSDKFAPDNLSDYPLGTWFKVYYGDGTYQYLPLSERTVTCKNGLLSYKVKLGNKASFLTDYIKKV